MKVHELQQHFAKEAHTGLQTRRREEDPSEPLVGHKPGLRQTRDWTLFHDQVHSIYLFLAQITAGQPFVKGSSPTRLCSGQFH